MSFHEFIRTLKTRSVPAVPVDPVGPVRRCCRDRLAKIFPIAGANAGLFAPATASCPPGGELAIFGFGFGHSPVHWKKEFNNVNMLFGEPIAREGQIAHLPSTARIHRWARRRGGVAPRGAGAAG
jgi:hypothetical protein